MRWSSACLVCSAISLISLTIPSTSTARDERPISYREVDGHRVAGIHFEYVQDKPLGNPELRAALQTQTGDRFRRRYFRADVTTIVNLYRSSGYMDAQISQRRFTLDGDDRLHIYLRIASGERWHVGRVQLDRVDSTYAGTEVLEDLVHVQAKETFRYGRVLEDERRLLAALNRSGHPHAQVQNGIDFDRTRRAADVVYRITAGPRMVFGALRVDPDSLHTRQSLIRRQLSFAEGDLYDPERLRRSRSNLAQTGLFRSVIFATAVSTQTDSVQPIILRLQERPYLHVESRAFASTEDLGLTGNVEHRNFLGRGNRIGTDASLGRPLQGATFYLTERNLLDSPGDLTISAGLTDEFSRTQVFVDPSDARQLDLLASLYGSAVGLDGGVYDYPSVERLWQLDATLGRNWLSPSGRIRYLTQMTMNWTQSRRQPQEDRQIRFDVDDVDLVRVDSEAGRGGDRFPVTEAWQRILTNEARALNFRIDLQRDTRDHPIVSRRGAFLRAEALFAFEFGGASTRVLDGTLEARHYQPVGERFVWAQAMQWVMTGSLRRDQRLPQAYWKSFGGEGSVRGLRRDAIQVVDGGRAGINVRNEVRMDVGPVSLVGFWDRAGIWRRGSDASWDSMEDGYGLGVRWDIGLPLRFDAGWDRTFNDPIMYLSIGQAF